METSQSIFNAKRRRCFHRVMSGIERGGRLRFLTLTSSNDSPPTIQPSWRKLVMRMRRRGLVKGYIKVPELSKNGKQHCHVLFRGTYIEQAWLSAQWQEIHGAKVVDIRKAVVGKSKTRIAAYLAKYMSKEGAGRYSWDWGWVWKGFVKDWCRLKRYWWRLREVGEHRSFTWLLTQWRLCLVYDVRPKLDGLYSVPGLT